MGEFQTAANDQSVVVPIIVSSSKQDKAIKEAFDPGRASEATITESGFDCEKIDMLDQLLALKNDLNA